MYTILTKRIEVSWKRIVKGVAVFLSLPPWIFIIAAVLFWSQIGKDDYIVWFWIIAGVCGLSSSVAFVLFFRSQDDSADSKPERFWLLCSGLPIALIPLLVAVNLVYGIVSGITHLAGMHDSL